MNCPNCARELAAVQVRSHYGAPIFLEQCPQCGGIWFDEDEVWRSGHGAAKQVGDLNQAALASTVPINTELHCPRDQAVLETRQLGLPYEIVLEHCPQCGGQWFNRGEFASFQDFRQTQRAKREKDDPEKNKTLARQIDALLRADKGSRYWETVGSFGRVLSRPTTQLPSHQEIATGNKVTSIITVLLRLLMLALRLIK